MRCGIIFAPWQLPGHDGRTGHGSTMGEREEGKLRDVISEQRGLENPTRRNLFPRRCMFFVQLLAK